MGKRERDGAAISSLVFKVLPGRDMPKIEKRKQQSWRWWSYRGTPSSVGALGRWPSPRECPVSGAPWLRRAYSACLAKGRKRLWEWIRPGAEPTPPSRSKTRARAPAGPAHPAQWPMAGSGRGMGGAYAGGASPGSRRSWSPRPAHWLCQERAQPRARRRSLPPSP